jgi:hypothetical protein
MPGTFHSLVEALLPLDCPTADRPVLAASADTLLTGRIAILAAPMRTAIRGVGALFHATACCALGCRFSRASLNRRREFVRRAEKVPLVPFRELVRLARSFTLMAFYDHPLTRQRMGFRPGGDRRSSS